jgi:hypothetical protein
MRISGSMSDVFSAPTEQPNYNFLFSNALSANEQRCISFDHVYPKTPLLHISGSKISGCEGGDEMGNS